MANAEDSIAQQLEEIRSLKKLLVVSSDLESGSEINLDHLVEELEQTKAQMAEDESSHQETVAKLLQEIKALEEEKAVHLDHSQRVDSEYSQLQEQVSSLQDKLQSEREIHEEELNRFKQQLQDSQNLLSEAKDRYATKVCAAEKELESAQIELAQYRDSVDSLTSKLHEAQVALEGSLARRHETVELQAEPPSEIPEESIAAKIGMLTTALEQSQEEIASYSEMNTNLQKQLQLFQATAAAAKDRAEEEVARLQSQLIAVHTEISDQATLYEEEIAQLKEDHKKQSDRGKKLAEIRLTESKEEYEKAARSLKHRCHLQVEVVQQELKGSQLRLKELQEKLLATEGECETALAEASQLRDREVQIQQQLTEYQSNEKWYKSKMSELKTDAERYHDELASLRVKEEQYRSQVAVLVDELQNRTTQKKSAVEGVAVDETDFGILEMTPPHRPSSRSSYRSDTSMHEETLTQMKTQLEDLQKMLMVPGKLSEEGGNEELSLIQELIATNNTLQNNVQKSQQNFHSEQQRCLGELEAAKQELKAGAPRIQALQEKLSMSEIQCENALMEATQLRDRGASDQQQIVDCQASEKRYESEISQLKINAEKQKDELAALKDKEQQYRNQIAILAGELKNTATQESPVSLERTPPHHRASRSPQKLNISTHEEMVAQMKSQLENLQTLLITQREASYEEGNSKELSLVQELLASNSALQSDMQKAQQSFQSEQQRRLSNTASKEEVLEQLRSEISKQKHAETLVTEFADKLLREMQNLQEKSNQVLEEYSTRIENTVSKVTTVQHTLGDRDQRHTGAVDSLLSELDVSKLALGTVKSEVGLLRSSLEKTQEDLNRSQSDMVDLQYAKEAEVERLKQEMDSLQNEVNVSKPSPAIATAVAVTTTGLESEARTESRAVEQGDEIELRGEVQALKDEIEQRNISEKKTQSSLEAMEAELYSLRSQVAYWQAEAKTKNTETIEIDAPRSDTSTQSIPSATTGTPAGKERAIQLRDRAIKRKDEEIKVLKEELEGAKLSKRAAQDAQVSAEAEVKKLQDKLREEQATLAAKRPALEDPEPKEKASSDKAHLEIKQRDEIIARKNEEIRKMTAEIDEANASMTESIHAQTLAETDIRRKHNELQRQEHRLSAYEQQIKELQRKLEAVVSEPVEAVIQYVESAPLESVSEAVFVELQQDIQAERAKVRDLQSLQTSAQQVHMNLY